MTMCARDVMAMGYNHLYNGNFLIVFLHVVLFKEQVHLCLSIYVTHLPLEGNAGNQSDFGSHATTSTEGIITATSATSLLETASQRETGCDCYAPVHDRWIVFHASRTLAKAK